MSGQRNAILAEAKSEIGPVVETLAYYVRNLKEVGATASTNDLEAIEGLLVEWLNT